MPIALPVEATISHKERLDDRPILPHRDHREILDVQINGHRHQVRVLFARFDLFRRDCFDLREVQGGGLGTQDQFGALVLPGRVTPARFKIPAQLDRIVVPFPRGASVDFETGEAGARARVQVGLVQVQGKRVVVEGRVVACSRAAWPPLLLAGCAPRRQIREKGAYFANGIFDHRAAVDEREIREPCAKIVAGQRMGMGAGFHGEGFGPGEQLVGGEEPLPFFLMLLREIAHLFCKFVRMGQEKGHIEGTGCVQKPGRFLEISALAAIGSSLFTVSEVEEQFGRACCLSHPASFLFRTKLLSI